MTDLHDVVMIVLRILLMIAFYNVVMTDLHDVVMLVICGILQDNLSGTHCQCEASPLVKQEAPLPKV
jgi:hypothetical protein